MELPWKDPLEIPPEELDRLNIEEYIFQLYRNVLLKKPRRKRYWQKEYEYKERVMKKLKEIKSSSEMRLPK